jgi:hypothetical protein
MDTVIRIVDIILDDLKHMYHHRKDLIWFILFIATFSNIKLYHERTTDHGKATGKLYNLRLWVECTLLCNLQSCAQTHTILAIGLYELLGKKEDKR